MRWAGPTWQVRWWLSHLVEGNIVFVALPLLLFNSTFLKYKNYLQSNFLKFNHIYIKKSANTYKYYSYTPSVRNYSSKK